MKTSKFFFSTLIAAAAMTATAYAELDSAYGSLEWTTAPSTGGDFWGGDYGLSFQFTDKLIKTLEEDAIYVLAAYWGSVGTTDSYGANAVVLNYVSATDSWTLQIGRGKLIGEGLDEDTTFAFQDSVTFSQAISVDTSYTLSVVGGNQEMTPTLSWGADSVETLSSYAGNMNGKVDSMNSGLLNLVYYSDTYLTWAGGNGTWNTIENTWTDSSAAFVERDNVEFSSSGATITLGEPILAGAVTISANTTLVMSGNTLSAATLSITDGSVLTINGDLEDVSSLASTGTGTIKGAFSDVWGNKLVLGSGFEGTVNVTGGRFTITTSDIGSGEYVLENGVAFQTGGDASISNNITFKGVHEFHTNSGHKLTLAGMLSASGVITKKGAGTLNVTGNSNNFSGTLRVESGTVYVGPGGENSGADANLTTTVNGAKIIVENGASFITHLGGGEPTSPKTFYGDVYVKNGATLGNKDGHVSLAGNLHWGVTNSGADVSTPTYSSDSVVTYTQLWGKTITFAGKLYGDGTVNLGQSSWEANANYVISGGDNTFAGTYSLAAGEGKTTSLKLLTSTAAEKAKIDLATSQTSLKLGVSAVTIAGLSGAGSVALNSGVSASALTVNGGGEFSGTIADGISVVKSGADTLTLSGDNSANKAGVTISAGTVVAAHKNALGSGNVTVGLKSGSDVTYATDLRLGTSEVVVNNLTGIGEILLADGVSASTLTVNSTADSTFDGQIYPEKNSDGTSGRTISLIKEGSNTLTLSKYNVLSSVTVKEGTLAVTAYAMGYNYPAGNIKAADVIVENGATLKVLTDGVEANALSFEKGATFALDLTRFAGLANAEETPLCIIGASALTFNGVDAATMSSEEIDSYLDLNNSVLGIYANANNRVWSYADGMLTLAIPEPSLFGVLAGLGALALVGTRRRRKKA